MQAAMSLRNIKVVISWLFRWGEHAAFSADIAKFFGLPKMLISVEAALLAGVAETKLISPFWFVAVWFAVILVIVNAGWSLFNKLQTAKHGLAAVTERSMAEIIDALDKAHTAGVALMANKMPDSNYHYRARAAWTMDTLSTMKKLYMRDHEIFRFQNPTALPDQDKCLRERVQILRSLIDKYMREKLK
jgi:hypothetical protein